MDRIAKYDAFDIPVGSIYYDSSFNCRGEFTPQSVLELSQSIAARGLDFPLVVQPAADVEGGLPGGELYRLLCGHRRFKAIVQFLKWLNLPCQVRIGLSDQKARLLNLTENLERNDLNPLEESRAIGRLFPSGTSQAEISKTLKRSQPWVYYRLAILKLPEELQQCIAARMLTVNDVRFLVTLPPERQVEAARVLMREGRKEVTEVKHKGGYRRKRRSQINRMIERLFEANLMGLCPRLLAWTAGAVSDSEIESDIQNEILRLSDPKYVLTNDGQNSH
jgi:ParB/RepB/Spo0J family partition protein